MRIYFLEEFQSADSTRSTALQRAYKGHSRYNLSHSYFPSYNPVWYSFCTIIQRVYIAWNGKFKPFGFISWKNFKVRTARDRQPHKEPTRATKDIIPIIFTYRDITQFDIRLHHYTACVYIAWNRKFKPCGFISWKNFKVRIARDRQPYEGLTKAIQGIISLMYTIRVITQFDIRSHHYTACA